MYGLPLEHDWPRSHTLLTLLLPRIYQLYPVMEHCVNLLLPGRNFVWPESVQVWHILSQLWWVHMCTCPTVHVSRNEFPCSFLPTSLNTTTTMMLDPWGDNDAWPFGGKVCYWCPIQGWSFYRFLFLESRRVLDLCANHHLLKKMKLRSFLLHDTIWKWENSFQTFGYLLNSFEPVYQKQTLSGRKFQLWPLNPV